MFVCFYFPSRAKVRMLQGIASYTVIILEKILCMLRFFAKEILFHRGFFPVYFVFLNKLIFWWLIKTSFLSFLKFVIVQVFLSLLTFLTLTRPERTKRLELDTFRWSESFGFNSVQWELQRCETLSRGNHETCLLSSIEMKIKFYP